MPAKAAFAAGICGGGVPRVGTPAMTAADGGAELRAAAARVLWQVVDHGHSLSDALAAAALKTMPARDRGFVRECVSGVLRHLPRYQFFLTQLLTHPQRARDARVEKLLLVGLHQLFAMDTPAYAAVGATVAACPLLDRAWARGWVNGVLRSAGRQRRQLEDAALSDEAARYSHPGWLIRMIRSDWPQDWTDILTANCRRAPMTLRVNLSRGSRDGYLELLAEADIDAAPTRYSDAGIRLATPAEVADLPGFAAGRVSVQDEAAQLVAPLLDVEPQHRVLDACAAPGGKTAHIGERFRPAALMALDCDPERVERLRVNVRRVGVGCAVREGDAADAAGWWDGAPFDRILVDAPCSATGIIRRQPDVKVHRRPADIELHAQRQLRILQGLWPTLKHGGKLLYTTCSVLCSENDDVIGRFAAHERDAAAAAIDADWGRATRHGRQVLPGESEMDGFFYACISKS